MPTLQKLINKEEKHLNYNRVMDHGCRVTLIVPYNRVNGTHNHMLPPSGTTQFHTSYSNSIKFSMKKQTFREQMIDFAEIYNQVLEIDQ